MHSHPYACFRPLRTEPPARLSVNRKQGLQQKFIGSNAPRLTRSRIVNQITRLQKGKVITIRVISSRNALRRSLTLLPPHFHKILFLHHNAVTATVAELSCIVFENIYHLISAKEYRYKVRNHLIRQSTFTNQEYRTISGKEGLMSALVFH